MQCQVKEVLFSLKTLELARGREADNGSKIGFQGEIPSFSTTPKLFLVFFGEERTKTEV
jgi:hypothetical protein